MAEHLMASAKLFIEKTMVPLLDPGRGRTKTGYLWALARDDRGAAMIRIRHCRSDQWRDLPHRGLHLCPRLGRTERGTDPARL
ncbi:IS66 family transposase [Pseudooceanicola spongiae]|uniref:IS66 family transposase n=1 Tax=Pseudooceanicola spongiae TaxID=2613965 RepID=UPI00299F8D53|nr:transposase [Pseudooceanicola spongiae]